MTSPAAKVSVSSGAGCRALAREWTRIAASALLTLALSLPAAQGSSVAYVANADDNTVSVVDESGAVVATIPVGIYPHAVAMNAQGTTAYVAYGSAEDGDVVTVIDMHSRAVIDTVSGLPGDGFGLAVTPDGGRVYVATNTALVGVIDTATNTLLPSVAAGSPGSSLLHLAITPNGAKVYVTDFNLDAVRVIRTADHAVTSITGLVDPIAVAVNPAGTRAYVTTVSGTIHLIDTATDTVLPTTITVGAEPIGIAVNPLLPRAYVSSYSSNEVAVIDTSSNQVIATQPFSGHPNGLGVSIDGARVYVASFDDGVVGVLDTATNTFGTPVTVGTSPFGYERFVGVDWILSDGFESGDTVRWVTN